MILITGVGGNTGSITLKKLCEFFPSNNIVGVSRDKNYKNIHNINIVYGDLNDKGFLERLYRNYNFSLVIHIANIRMSEDILDFSERFGVKKNILVHTTGIYSKYQEYNQLYNSIEKNIKEKEYLNTTYVILRPSMIYGNERDYNMHKLIKVLNKTPVFPVFGNGKSLMQPIHVEDLSQAIVDVVMREDIINQDFNITGESVLEYKEIIKMISKKLNRKVFIFKIPINIAILGMKILKKLTGKSIVTVEQIERLQEDKAYSHTKATEFFGFNPRSFDVGITQEIQILRNKKII